MWVAPSETAGSGKDSRRKSGAFQSPLWSAKKWHENDRNNFRRATQRGAKERRITRSASFVEDSCRTRDGNKKNAPVQATGKLTDSRSKSANSKQPVDRGGCGSLRIIDDVQKMKEKYDLIVVDQNTMQQGHRDWKCLQAVVWKLRHWRAAVQ